MKIGKKMEDAINQQITHEFEAERTYLSIAAYFEELSFKGFAHWMYKQASEERTHAMKFFSYLCERGGAVSVDGVEKPASGFKSPLAAFEAAYAFELSTTKKINALYELAISEKDHATASMLKWFIDEQVEEEDNAAQNIEQVKMAGDSKGALLHLDHRLGKRE
jgi:ferritin